MKRCPKCKREYQDELNFCPDDQSALIDLQPKGNPMVGKIYSAGDVNITVNEGSDNDKAIEEVLENRESIEEVNQKVDNLSNNINKLFAPKSPKGTEPIPIIKESQLNELRKFDDLQKQNSEKKKKDFAQQIKNDAILRSAVANKEGKDTKVGCGCWALAAGLFGLLIMWNKFNGCTFSTLSSEEIYEDLQGQSSLKTENNNLKKQLEEEKNLRKTNEEKNKFEKEFVNKSNKTENLKNYHAGEHKQNSGVVRRMQQIELEELQRKEAHKRQEWMRKELERKKAQQLAQLEELKLIAELKKTYLLNLKYVYLNFVREYWIERGAISGYRKQSMLVRGRMGSSI